MYGWTHSYHHIWCCSIQIDTLGMRFSSLQEHINNISGSSLVSVGPGLTHWQPQYMKDISKNIERIKAVIVEKKFKDQPVITTGMDGQVSYPWSGICSISTIYVYDYVRM